MALHLSTILARTPDGILAHLAHRLPRSCLQNFLLFTLSANVNGPQLSALVSGLTSLSPQSIGCLSAPYTEDLITCSVAIFRSKNCVPFRSTILGAPAPRVGRWHAFSSKRNVDHPGEANYAFNRQDVFGGGANEIALPPDLHGLR